jgi:hypothetical protein
LRAARSALASEDRIRGVRDYTVGLHATLSFSGQQLEALATEQVLLPDKSRTALSIPAAGQNVIQVLNGSAGWIQQAGKTADSPGPETAQFKESLIRTQLTLFLTSPDGSLPKAQVLADQNLDGKPVDVVLATGPDGLKTTLFFDKQTHLLVRAQYRTVHPITQQPSLAQEDYSDYKPEDGIMVAHHTVILMNGEKFSDETLTELKINTGVPASIFEKK